MPHSYSGDELTEILAADRQARGTGNGKRNGNGVMWEIAKILIPAALAMGGAYLSVNTQITELKGQVRSLTDTVQKIETMLGIGVYKGANR